VTDESEFEKLIQIALDTDPGQTNAADPNIEKFLKKGKLITYVGLADVLIPTGSTLWSVVFPSCVKNPIELIQKCRYRQLVIDALGYDPSDSYRTFAGWSMSSREPL
jgi:hypothetical protein